MARIIGYRLPEELIGPTMNEVALHLLEALEGTDWLGVQLTVMRDGTVTYDVQVIEESNDG